MNNFDEKSSLLNSTIGVFGETVTFNAIGPYKYLVYIAQYLDKTTFNQPQIQSTNARLDVYTPTFE